MANVNFNTGFISGEIVDIKNGKLINKGNKKEALKVTIEIDTGNNYIIPVDFFISKYTFTGKVNKVFGLTKRIYEECKTRVDNEQGDMITCIVEFENNSYVNKNGNIINKVKCTGRYIISPKEGQSVNKGARGSLYGIYKSMRRVNGYLELTLLFNNYAYKNKEGESKAKGFIGTIRTYNEEYMEYLENELSIGDLVFVQFNLSQKIKKKTRGIGESLFREEFYELTNCSAPIMSLNDEGVYEKCIYDDLEEGEEEELCYTVMNLDNFPFTLEYIDLMYKDMEETRKELEAKANEIILSNSANNDENNEEIGEDEIPF